MPKLEHTLTNSVKGESIIAPEIVARLEPALQTYAELKIQADLLDAAMNAEKATIRELLEAHSLESVKAGGFALRMVRGTTSTLDKQKLYALGVTQAMIEEATVVRPKKAYLDIRKAGEGNED